DCRGPRGLRLSGLAVVGLDRGRVSRAALPRGRPGGHTRDQINLRERRRPGPLRAGPAPPALLGVGAARGIIPLAGQDPGGPGPAGDRRPTQGGPVLTTLDLIGTAAFAASG